MFYSTNVILFIDFYQIIYCYNIMRFIQIISVFFCLKLNSQRLD